MEKVESKKELTEEAKKQLSLMEEAIAFKNKDAKTNVLSLLKFDSKLDKKVFFMLPLSDAQKEEVVLSMAKQT